MADYACYRKCLSRILLFMLCFCINVHIWLFYLVLLIPFYVLSVASPGVFGQATARSSQLTCLSKRKKTQNILGLDRAVFCMCSGGKPQLSLTGVHRG